MRQLAKISAALTRIYINKYDVSGLLNGANLDITQETPDIGTFADEGAGPRHLVANYDYQSRVTGFFDAFLNGLGSDSNFDAMIHGLMGATDHSITMIPALTQGEVAYDQLAAMDGEPRRWAMGAAVMLDASFKGSGGLSRGLVLRTGTVTATGNGTGYNQGATNQASVTGQIYAVNFRVLGGTYTSLTLRVQESSDNGAGDAYTDISGLTATFSTANAYGHSRVTTSAATEAWKRVSVQAFTGTSAVILVTAGVVARTP